MTLRTVPVDRVVHLAGVSAGTVSSTLARCDELPAAVVLTPFSTGSVAAFVTEVLNLLDAVARQLLPSWLPEAEALDGPQGAARAAIRAAATERARVAGCSSAFLADLAERALTGRPSRGRLRPEARAAALARVVAMGFQRDRLVLAVPGEPATAEASAREVMVAGSEWLTARGRLGVWLTGAGWPGLERISAVEIPTASPGPGLSVPATAGRPHPRSSVESALEAVLAREEWAYGRIWNGTYQPALLRNPIRPDLWWPDERVVVELDGIEHCRPEKYDADRVRDVQLQLDGYAVLRFTNARVTHDVQAVAVQIGQLVRARRHDMAKGQQGG